LTIMNVLSEFANTFTPVYNSIRTRKVWSLLSKQFFFLFCRFLKKCYLIIASEDFSSQFARNRSFRTIPNQPIKNVYAVRHVYDPDGNLIGVERVTEKSTAELANGEKFHRSL
jgi:hypothetical protein